MSGERNEETVSSTVLVQVHPKREGRHFVRSVGAPFSLQDSSHRPDFYRFMLSCRVVPRIQAFPGTSLT